MLRSPYLLLHTYILVLCLSLTVSVSCRQADGKHLELGPAEGMGHLVNLLEMENEKYRRTILYPLMGDMMVSVVVGTTECGWVGEGHA